MRSPLHSCVCSTLLRNHSAASATGCWTQLHPLTSISHSHRWATRCVRTDCPIDSSHDSCSSSLKFAKSSSSSSNNSSRRRRRKPCRSHPRRRRQVPPLRCTLLSRPLRRCRCLLAVMQRRLKTAPPRRSRRMRTPAALICRCSTRLCVSPRQMRRTLTQRRERMRMRCM